MATLAYDADLARERLEAVARAKPRDLDGVREIPELRAWQIEVLGPAFVKALRDLPNGAGAPAAAAEPEVVEADGSPYRDD